MKNMIFCLLFTELCVLSVRESWVYRCHMSALHSFSHNLFKLLESLSDWFLIVSRAASMKEVDDVPILELLESSSLLYDTVQNVLKCSNKNREHFHFCCCNKSREISHSILNAVGLRFKFCLSNMTKTQDKNNASLFRVNCTAYVTKLNSEFSHFHSHRLHA